MSYSDFTIDLLKEQFAIELIEDVLLFPNPSVSPVPQRLAELLQSSLSRNYHKYGKSAF